MYGLRLWNILKEQRPGTWSRGHRWKHLWPFREIHLAPTFKYSFSHKLSLLQRHNTILKKGDDITIALILVVELIGNFSLRSKSNSVLSWDGLNGKSILQLLISVIFWLKEARCAAWSRHIFIKRCCAATFGQHTNQIESLIAPRLCKSVFNVLTKAN